MLDGYQYTDKFKCKSMPFFQFSSTGSNSHNGSLLLEASEKGDVDTVKRVLESTQINPDKKTKYQSRSALHQACGYGQLNVVEELLKARLDSQNLFPSKKCLYWF